MPAAPTTAPRDCRRSSSWSHLRVQEKQAGEGRSWSPHNRAQQALKALKPTTTTTRPGVAPMRWKAHSSTGVVPSDPPRELDQDGPRVGTVGSTRLPIRDPSFEGDRPGVVLEGCRSLPGTQEAELDVPVGSTQQRRHSTMGMAACREEASEQGQHEQQGQQRRWQGQGQQEERRGEFYRAPLRGPVQGAESIARRVAPVFASSLYAPANVR